MSTDLIVDGLCRYYGIERAQLMIRSGRSPEAVLRRRYAVKILRDHGYLTFKEISNTLGYKGEVATIYLYKGLNDLLSGNSWGDRAVYREYSKIVKYLISNSKNKDYENKDENTKQETGKAVKV